jgi:hypothetical protein
LIRIQLASFNKAPLQNRSAQYSFNGSIFYILYAY